jgi:hypothetical protein
LRVAGYELLGGSKNRARFLIYDWRFMIEKNWVKRENCGRKIKNEKIGDPLGVNCP